MDWFRAVDGYCERTDASFWSEPLNAVSNAAFLIAAWAAWRIAAGAGDRGGQLLAGLVAVIGVGSWLFHTHAQVWAMVADVVPIQVFILVYLGMATVRLFGVPWWGGVLAAAAFVPASAGLARAIGAVTGSLNGSVGYLPVPVLIAGYAWLVRRKAPAVARGFAVGAGILAVSLALRTVDAAVCAAFPWGTHWAWHLLNGVMLWWMVRVLVREAGVRTASSGR